MKLTVLGKTFHVETLADASRKYEEINSATGKRRKAWRDGRVIDGDDEYRISPNGRVWSGEWPNSTLIMEAPNA